MKNLHKYLICLIIGILLYLLFNNRNGFSVGGKKFGLYEKGSSDHIADHIAESEGDAINHFIQTVLNFDLTNLHDVREMVEEIVEETFIWEIIERKYNTTPMRLDIWLGTSAIRDAHLPPPPNDIWMTVINGSAFVKKWLHYTPPNDKIKGIIKLFKTKKDAQGNNNVEYILDLGEPGPPASEYGSIDVLTKVDGTIDLLVDLDNTEEKIQIEFLNEPDYNNFIKHLPPDDQLFETRVLEYWKQPEYNNTDNTHQNLFYREALRTASGKYKYHSASGVWGDFRWWDIPTRTDVTMEGTTRTEVHEKAVQYNWDDSNKPPPETGLWHDEDTTFQDIFRNLSKNPEIGIYGALEQLESVQALVEQEERIGEDGRSYTYDEFIQFGMGDEDEWLQATISTLTPVAGADVESSIAQENI